MKNYALICSALCLATFCSSTATTRLSDYVNPIIGASTSTTIAHAEHGLGKTFPGATTPWGMTQVSPNTINGGDNGSGYSFEHTSIEGFAMTQLSGIGWYGDMGNFLVMPSVGPLHTWRGDLDNPDEGYRSRYDKNSETAKAGYYGVHLTDYDIHAEVTATPHGGVMRFTYPEADTSRLQVDLARRVGGTSTRQRIEVLNDSTFRGWMRCTPDGGGWGNGSGNANYTVYFYSVISRPMTDYGVWTALVPAGADRHLQSVTSVDFAKRTATAEIVKGIKAFEGNHIGFFTEFPTEKGDCVTLRTAISFVSMEGAEANFKAELADNTDFDFYRQAAASLWDDALAKITVEGGSPDDLTIFYTALYHTMIDPRCFTDVTGEYPGADGKIHTTDRYTRRTVFSGWDVFRSQFPLQTIINPVVVNDMVNSFIDLAKENGSGVYDRWELLNAYSGCMLGNPAISVIADAMAKGITDFDTATAFAQCRRTADTIGHHPDLGYSPGGSSISETLEYAYTDWCVAQIAHILGDSSAEKEYLDRGQAYRNIFDAEKGWFRPRNADGSWAEWPEKGRMQEWYGCMECNPYQQGWFVPHDVDGLVELLGGCDAALADLQSMFENTPVEFWWNEYYNHANEPVHHVPFLFNRLGAPELTQKWTNHICRKAYRNAVDGLCGNEDVGQMSAWYILAASGFHPLCPGLPEYELTSPLFDRIIFNLPSGKKFVISAHRQSPDAIYIDSVLLNGEKVTGTVIPHSAIVNGGTLHFNLIEK